MHVQLRETASLPPRQILASLHRGVDTPHRLQFLDTSPDIRHEIRILALDVCQLLLRHWCRRQLDRILGCILHFIDAWRASYNTTPEASSAPHTGLNMTLCPASPQTDKSGNSLLVSTLPAKGFPRPREFPSFAYDRLDGSLDSLARQASWFMTQISIASGSRRVRESAGTRLYRKG